MNRLAKEEFCFGRHISLEEIITSLERVSPRQVSDEAREMLNSGRFTIVVLGPVDSKSDLFGLFYG